MPVEAVRGIPWTLLSYAATRVITLATTLVLARLLVPADFGLFAMATLGMELLSVFSGLWLGSALVLREDMDRRAQGTVLTLLVAAGAALALLLVALAPALAAFFGEPRLAQVVLLLAAVLLICGVNWFYETILQRELAFRRRFACQVANTLAFSAVSLSLALAGAGVWALIAGYAAGYLANVTALLIVTPYRVRPAFDRAEARRIVRGGRGFLWQDLSGFIGENVDYLCVGRLLGPSQLGLYAMAFRQASLPQYAIAEPVAKVTFPAFAQMRQRGEDVRPAFLHALRMIALVTCPIGVLLSAAAVPFALALLGPKWLPMAGPLAVLGLWGVLRPLQTTTGYLLNSLGRADLYGRVAMLSLLPLAYGVFAASALGTVTTVAWVLLGHMAICFGVLAVAAAHVADVPVRRLGAALWPFAAASLVAWLETRGVVTQLASGWPPGLALVAAGVVDLAAYVAVLSLIDADLLMSALNGARRALGREPRGARLRPRSRLPGLALACAGLGGVAAAVAPKLALALVVGGLLIALAFAMPVTHLVLLLMITAIVPFDVQNAGAFGAGPGSPGLFVSDVLLAGGLVRASLVLLDDRLDRRARWLLVLALAALAVAVLQALHGIRAGSAAGAAGTELRVLVGFGAAVIALPLLRDPATRGRLFTGLAWVGLAVGVWGMVQWLVDLPFTAAQDAGVRAGVRFTTEGRGQIQGGLFAFPVAVVMGVAALLSHELRSRRARALLVAVVALNAAGLLLTYERTFWVATVIGLGFVVLRAAPAQRRRVLAVAPPVAAAGLATLAIGAPREWEAAKQRALSLGEYGSDLSVRFRLTETRHVVAAIQAHPLTGSGLGATILWGRPYEGVRATEESFAHDGYLWLVWKLGLPATVLLLLLLIAAVLSRGPPTTTTFGAVRVGAQAGLLLLLIASVTFPAFATLGITAVMGVMVALCT
jgi:O-antigen/teichoic acid export membrane protein